MGYIDLDEATHVLCTLVICGTCFVSACLMCCFGLYLFLKHRKRQYFVKRRPLVTSLIGFCGMIFLFWTNLRFIEISLHEIPYFDINREITQDIMFEILKYLFIVPFGFFGTLAVVRCWLFYYDMELSRALRNHRWQMAIDPNIASNNWFLNVKNQKRYKKANAKYLLIFGMIVDICIYSIQIFYLWDINSQAAIAIWAIWACLKVCIRFVNDH